MATNPQRGQPVPVSANADDGWSLFVNWHPPYALAAQHHVGGGLLGGSLAGALALCGWQVADPHLGPEAGGVIGSVTLDLAVSGQRPARAAISARTCH
jgi:hypothetical protein